MHKINTDYQVNFFNHSNISAFNIFFISLLCIAISGCNQTNVIQNEEPEQNVVTKQTEPTNFANLEYSANEAYKNQDWESAEVQYKKLLEIQPDNSEYWLNLGNIYFSKNQSELAIHAYRQALIRDSKNIKAWNNLGLTQLHQATVTFLNMKNQLAEDDPMYIRISAIIDRITELMVNEFNVSPPEGK